jgi:hypothetical protein
VRLNCVRRETDQLDTTLGELGLELCEGAQLGCADRSVIIRVREQNSPLVADEVVEINGATGSFGLEVGSD